MGTSMAPYPGNQTAPSRMGGGYASDQPTVTPALNDIQLRLCNLRDLATKLTERLTNTADRALGGEPRPPSSTNGGGVKPSLGMASDIVDMLMHLDAIVNAAHEQALRLERVA